MPITGVMPLPAVRNSTFVGRTGGSTKSPAAWSSMTSVPDAGAAHEVVADRSAVHGLHRDRDAAVGAVGVRGEGVGAPLAHAVDVDAETHVLARVRARASRARA